MPLYDEIKPEIERKLSQFDDVAKIAAVALAVALARGVALFKVLI